MIKWKDITSYSRSDKVKEPRVFESVAGPVRLSLVKNHRHYPDSTWVGSAYPLFEETSLKAETLEEAKKEIIQMVEKIARDILDKIGQLEQF